jgi:hypothetical protein
MRSVDAEMRGLWESLSANERRVLLAIASGLSPTEASALPLTGLRNRSSAQRATEGLVARAVVERGERGALSIVDPLLLRWTRRRGGARPTAYVLPARTAGGFVVTDGPSLAFERSRHALLDDAERAAAQIVATGRSGGGDDGDVIVFDSDDPNDLPDWAFA